MQEEAEEKLKKPASAAKKQPKKAEPKAPKKEEVTTTRKSRRVDNDEYEKYNNLLNTKRQRSTNKKAPVNDAPVEHNHN